MADIFGKFDHFCYLNAITQNTDKYFYDSFHFYPEVGDLIVDHFNGIVHKDFGIKMERNIGSVSNQGKGLIFPLSELMLGMQIIAETAKIYPNVKLGRNVVIEDFCLIGVPPRGSKEGELETVIGDNSVIRSHTVIYAGNKIGNNFQTGNKANIRELNEIADNVSIGTLSVVEHHVKIEEGVRIHTQVFIPEYSTLKKNSWVGPNVVFTNAPYPKSKNVKDELVGPVLHENAIVGANSTLLPGVQIGRDAIVGAGSVVTKDVAEGTVVAGNPAKFLKKKSELPYQDKI